MNGPWFLTGGSTAVAVLLLAVLVGGAFARAEWLRADPRWQWARVGATLAASFALALLALRPAARPRAEAPGDATGAEVALWTGGPRSTDEAETLRKVPPPRRFRLPGAEAPEGTPTIPDPAALGRHEPRIGTLHLFGDGLTTEDLTRLAPGQVDFHPGADGANPRFTFVHAPRTLVLGERWSLSGTVRGGAPGEARSVAWEGPDRGIIVVPVAPDGTFRLHAPGLPTPGRYGWKLRLIGPGERVLEDWPGGVSVTAADLPRVLILETSPQPDTATLRRWLGEAGGAVTVRTEIGRGRFRFAADGGVPGEFSGLDPALLSHYDLVVLDAKILTELPAAERAALARVVERDGLGVLVRGEPPPAVGGQPDAAPPADREFFLPWRLVRLDGAAVPDPEARPPARLRWAARAGEETAPETPVPVSPLRIVPEGVDGAVVLVRDGQGRAVTARVDRGHGRVALTLTEDTARWPRAGEPGAFAAFWSAVLGDLAAPAATGAAKGRWTLVGDAATGPLARVGGPVDLRWEGAGAVAIPPPATVTAEDAPPGEPPLPLPLVQDLAEPSHWSGRCWPRHAGWHRVSTSGGGGPTLDFFVAPADAWPGVRAAARRGDTMGLAVRGEFFPRPEPTHSEPVEPLTDSRGAAAGLFLVFVVSAGFLWAEARRSLGSSPRRRSDEPG